MTASAPRRLEFLFLLLLALSSLVPGCTPRPALPAAAKGAGLELHDLGNLPGARNLSWNESGTTLLAISDAGLVLVRPGSGARQLLPGPAPASAAWGPNGSIAVAWNEEAGCRLALLEKSGVVRSAVHLPGRVTSLARAGAEVIASLLALETFSFGSHCQLELVRWNGHDAPQRSPLWETTLKPGSAERLGRHLFTVAALAPAPDSEELLLGEIHDPPAARLYSRIILLPLAGNTGRILVNLAGIAPPGRWLGDGETFLFTDGGTLFRFAPRLEERPQPLGPGRRLHAVTPAGDWQLVDDQLRHHDLPLAQFPGLSSGSFAPDGTTLALADQGRLLLVTGLKTEPAPPPPTDRERLRKLRHWWRAGLIDNDDYRNARKELWP
ncbi:hypothetical protein [Desulfuromonas carbonis]